MRKTVTWGLFLAWLANDLEEWFTMAPWSERHAARQESKPVGPPWLRQEISPARARTAIALMGLIILAASARGAQTEGESSFFQSAVVGFGAHGVGHLALSAAHHGYTPGVITAPTVVIPYSLWAWRKLGKAGTKRNAARALLGSIILLPTSLAAAHIGARLLIERKPAQTS